MTAQSSSNMTLLLQTDIQDFIVQHEGDDIQALALKAMPADWPRTDILNQIKARQKAKLKIPSWLEASQKIIFPAPDLIEQASSDATARYKASLFNGTSFLDLTGGVGVDCAAFASEFDQVTCVEKHSAAAALLRHNLPLRIGDVSLVVVEEDAISYVDRMETVVDLVYIDPQRRTDQRKGLKYLEECSPNILTLLPLLQKKAHHILIKTSPMLDIDQALTQLPQTHTVYVIERRRECREVLYHLTPDPSVPPTIHAVNVDHDGTGTHILSFTRAQEKEAAVRYDVPQTYLYEPGPAFLKSGGYKLLSERYNVAKLHPHTHLYTSETLVSDFPGRIFDILGVYPVRKNALPLKKANLAIRNFSDDIKTLYKRLSLKAGGSDMVFACTLEDARKVLIHAKIVS